MNRRLATTVILALVAAAPLWPGVLAAPPANDQCPGAVVIPPSGPFPYLAPIVPNVSQATSTGDPPAPSCAALVSRSIWYSFIPEASGSYSISSCAEETGTTVPDTLLAVYTATDGTCAGTLTEVAGGCADTGCTVKKLQSVLGSVYLEAGTRYFILSYVGGNAAPPPGSTAVQLKIGRNPPGPPNDTCEGAVAVPPDGPFPWLSPVTNNISYATSKGDPPVPSCRRFVSRSTWYTFTPQRGGTYELSLCADAPTATTVDDTVLAVYTSTGGCAGQLTQVQGGCDNDGCGVEAGQSVIAGLDLSAGTPYYILAYDADNSPPSPGNTAMQLRVDLMPVPGNDACATATPLLLDEPRTGTTVAAANDYQLPPGSTCFAGIAQTATTAPGRDVVYGFTAPAEGAYSFRVTGHATALNNVLYVATDCTPWPGPSTVAGCLKAANRNLSNGAEEVDCVPLAAGQQVFVYADESALNSGSPFTIEANRCEREREPNDAPAEAAPFACGLEGSIGSIADEDFVALQSPDANSRVFALVDGISAGNGDFDLQLTTATDTLEYDDMDNDILFGAVAPNIAGSPSPGLPVYLRVSQINDFPTEPYRLYATVQPASSLPTPEQEPNDTLATATSGTNDYFSGALSSAADVDDFFFSANAGELLFLSLDTDPTRGNTPFNGTLALLDSAGTVLMAVDDPQDISDPTPGPGYLTWDHPNSPGEGLVYRVKKKGTYFARVSSASGQPGDYLLSVTHDCRTKPGTDLAVTQADAPDPVQPGANVTYTVWVSNLGPNTAALTQLRDDLPVGATLVSAVPSQGTCRGDAPIACALGTILPGGTAIVNLTVTAPVAPGWMINTARALSMTVDINPANDSTAQRTTVGSDADGDGFPDALDCAPADPAAWSLPGEATGLTFPGAPSDRSTMSWSSPAVIGGTVVIYDLIRSDSPRDFSTPACPAKGILGLSASDAWAPPAAKAFNYLVRARNACGENTGTRSDGTPRSGGSCP